MPRNGFETSFTERTAAVDGVLTRYRIYEPPGLAAASPLILFLHGAGESGTDNLAQTTVGIGPAILQQPERFPALVVFPQASQGYGWRGFNMQAAFAALYDAEREYNVDRCRVYVTGISMGGYGTWLAALLQPERFAAIVPICGGLDVAAAIAAGVVAANDPRGNAAVRLATVPQWVFHGAADNIIPVEESRLMVAALQRSGTPVTYTEYANVRHNSWDAAYAEPELLPWLLQQTRRAAPTGS